VASPERPLIDRLVRLHAVPREEVLRLEAFEPARRGDLAYWLARVWGWRESRLSGAFADVPDSLEPWLDGLLKHRVLGAQASLEWIQPFAIAGLGTALDWCDAAARAGNDFRLSPAEDASFRRGLLAGVSIRTGRSPRGTAFADTLTRAQVLGMVSNARFPTLRVLETTDFHGAILPGPKDRRTGRAIGSSVVLAAWIEKLRAENPEGTVLIDGGDCFQGTMISNLQYGRPVVEQMNDLGYVACAVGNHDFDWSADTLVRRARESRYAELGANCLERKTGRIPKPMAADTTVVRRGVRVSILGLCYRNTPSVTLAANVAHLRFEDDSATAARRVPELRKRERPDAVLVVGHIPAETDSLRHAKSGDLTRVAQVPGVDAFFGGHSHNQVSDQIHGVPVMIAGSHGQYIAVCDLAVDPVKHQVVESFSHLQPTWADEVTPDSAWVARVARWNAAVGTAGAEPVARSARALNRSGPESAVGDLVADAMRAKSGADVALQNTGGLRADLPEGMLTKGNVYEVMPFDNTIFVQELTGAELKLALEQGLRRNRVTQVSGIRWSFDASRPELQRVVSFARSDGTPIDDARTYRVACNNFMATGGDEYDVLANGRNRRDTGLTVRDALEEYLTELAKTGPIDYRTDGRIQRIGEAR
jgi:2',3'-cyclic-nucleotide 2'-phosphodiesterase (5'-nucleotidase family)